MVNCGKKYFVDNLKSENPMPDFLRTTHYYSTTNPSTLNTCKVPTIFKLS